MTSSVCPPATFLAAPLSSPCCVPHSSPFENRPPSPAAPIPSFLTSDISLPLYLYFPQGQVSKSLKSPLRKQDSHCAHAVSPSPFMAQVLQRGLHCLKARSPPTYCSWPLSPLCNDLLSDVGSSLLSAGAKGLGSSWPVATPPQRSLLPSLLSGVSFRLSLCSFSYPSPLAPEECRFSSRTLPGLTLPPVSLPGE